MQISNSCKPDFPRHILSQIGAGGPVSGQQDDHRRSTGHDIRTLEFQADRARHADGRRDGLLRAGMAGSARSGRAAAVAGVRIGPFGVVRGCGQS